MNAPLRLPPSLQLLARLEQTQWWDAFPQKANGKFEDFISMVAQN
jgi:hypothetical protein